MIYTHVLSSAIVFIILIIYLVVNIKTIIKEYKRLIYLFIAGVVTLILTSAYIVPMIEQMLSNSFYFSSNPSTDITYSLYKMNDIIAGMFNNIESSYKPAPDPKIGGVLIALLFVRIAVKSKSNQLKHIDIWVFIGLALILTASYSFPWNLFPFNKLTFIQHPCRLLLIVSFIFSLAGGYYLNEALNNRNRKLIAVLCLSLVLLLILKSDGASTKIIFKDHPKLNNQLDYNLTIGGAEYLPAKFPSPYQSFVEERGSNIICDNFQTSISNFNKKNGSVYFDVNITSTDKIELPLTYYIGYKATLNGDEINYKQSENGLIQLPINQSGKVEIQYTGTTLQTLSYYIIIVTFILFIAYIIYANRIDKEEKKA